ncbi:uncharacterized protein GGS22DRAFT_88646 [Annulohypoxylon maeteangense]|uniref:uncharacterized protein n=1 Tax=Annulohypoxylon maeteangense TaxID=1927788 RepID=UPI0020077D7F|nr:uncharacterized protein GGS22DRAFT_88646 [Annulohypoxylon maeteangense]KAI0887753.1 hypothetical protein GGS22DRAFT_88646 [Annulohypoxylon maeteangense]
MSRSRETCSHEALLLEPSAYAKEVGYSWPSSDRRLAATTKSGRNPLIRKGQKVEDVEKLSEAIANNLSGTFPGPLILPGDELALDPKDPPQSFRSWLNEGLRKNRKLNRKCKTLYVAIAPEITSSVSFMKAGLQPSVRKGSRVTATKSLDPPSPEDIIKYTGAFYHGLLVEAFPGSFQFVPWDESKKSRKSDSDTGYVGLLAGKNSTRIRYRPSPDGVFKYQLNLNDLIDAAIEMLTGDAYSLLLLVNHDMYEDEDDVFCCGRAYGADRVAVVSTARYHPALDDHANIDFAHMWPTSHCKSYVDQLCGEEGLRQDTEMATRVANTSGPLRAAVEAIRGFENSALEDPRGLWFSRITRTVVHELGHCLGFAHCVYYACAMQSSSCMAEDLRQPPYLCPVCLGKVSHAIACELEGRDEAGKYEYVKDRYRSIADFCDSWKHVGLFAGYGAWLRARLEQLDIT